MRLEKEYKKTGFFWLSNEENKIPGILSIKDGGVVELEVVGLFNENITEFDNNTNIDRIIGFVEDDGYVTLDNCFYIKKNFPFGGISKSKLRINKVLSGVAYGKDEKITFNTLSFSVECMDEWVRITGIKVEHDWENRTAKINYEPPDLISHRLDNGMELEIGFAYTLPGSPITTEAKITQNTYFRLKSEDLRSLDDFIEIAYKITSLLCFAIDETVSLKNVYATSSELLADNANGIVKPVSICIYYTSIPFIEKVPQKNWHDMLFSFTSIKTNAEVVFNNWIKAYDDIAPALSLYFSTKAGAQKYIDGKFLALVQGLETYHRRISDETLMDVAEFESLVNEIQKKCPKEHAEWLRSRLIYGNEISLAKRINRIIEPFMHLFGSKSDIKKLIRSITDTRNYLTHYNEALKDKSANGRELWILCQKMEIIFQLHFLKVIGFNDELIQNVVENCFPIKRKLKELQ